MPDTSDPVANAIAEIEKLRGQVPDAQIEVMLAPLRAQLAASNATVSGSGAVAQGGGDALGERALKLRDNYAPINTGTQIIEHYYAATNEKRFSKEEIAQRVTGYLRWLRERTESIELRGIERAGGAPVVLLPLETAYVPLRARRLSQSAHLSLPSSPLDTPLQEANLALRVGLGQVRVETEADIQLNEVLAVGNRLVIIGGPGSGKTTVLLHIAWALASSLLTGQPEPARSRLGVSIEPNALPLPIFVPLASFARHRRSLASSAPGRDKTLAHFISHHLISKQADFDLPADFFVQLLKDGRDVLLLLDGLDEVANENERAEVRQSVEELVGGREAMRIVVTCRTVAYRSGHTALGASFREVTVQALEYEPHIAPMVQQAYACIYPHGAALRADRTRDLLDGIHRLEEERRARLGEHAEVLVHSPLMVRLLLIVHFNNRTLPDERADLFDKAISALLQVDYGREESDRRELSTDWKRYRDMAQYLAFHMHQQGRDQGREIEEAVLKKALREEAEFKDYIDAFVTHARQRGSVLEERGGVYRFIHLAFQEFLVARHLREVIGAEGREAILATLDKRLDDPWWREPILLLVGYMGANAAKSGRDFIAALTKAGNAPNAQFSAAELAGTAAAEWRESGEGTRESCASRIVNLLNDKEALRDSKPVVRSRAGAALARLGDQRFDRDRFFLPADDMLGFVDIPADPAFKIGTRKEHFERVMTNVGASQAKCESAKDEINDALTPTPEFYIERFPVTVAQFRAFVESTGFKLNESDVLRYPDTWPVASVSWHEALAYCEWLNEVIAASPAFEADHVSRLLRSGQWRVTLPSELEWEKAARGGLKDAVFSWGDEPDQNRANCKASEVHDRSAVGCFPANGFGLYDMLGNVWEWTRSLHKPYPYRADDGREHLGAGDDAQRVIRGGSFYFDFGDARCAGRFNGFPISRFYFIGFRVVLRSIVP
jgi:formylglycine-generating enzyme required for sulfatase activity